MESNCREKYQTNYPMNYGVNVIPEWVKYLIGVYYSPLKDRIKSQLGRYYINSEPKYGKP